MSVTRVEISHAKSEEDDKLNNSNLLEEYAFDGVPEKRRCWSETTKKTVIGLVIVFFLAVSWVGAQQFGQSAVQLSSFNAPYFTTWFSTCWMTLCYPCYCLFVAISKRNKRDFMASIRASLCIFEESAVTVKQFFTKVFPMNILWLLSNYSYMFGLKYIAATVASSIMAANVAVVYFLSLTVLRERFYVIRLIASIFCILGVVLFGYAEGFEGTLTLVGVALAFFSAVCAAVYKVIFKKMVGSASLGKVSLFLSLLGLSNATLLWTVFIILYFTGVENFNAADIPWPDLTASASLSLVFNFLVNFGIAFTYPLFISISMMLGIPLNAAVDVIFRSVTFDVLRLVAALSVIIGFGIMLFPDTWNDPFHRKLGCRLSTVTEDAQASEEGPCSTENEDKDGGGESTQIMKSAF